MTTTDELALLAAVCEHPADDTPRLAYADWLDEHADDVLACPGEAMHRHSGRAGHVIHGVRHISDPRIPHHHHDEKCPRKSDGRRERAEFIRVQVQLAKDDAEDAANGRMGTNPLRRRERELLGAAVGYVNPGYRHAWFPLDLGVRYSTRVHGDTLTLLTGDGPRMSATFRRGFVDEVRCTAADWLTHADRLVWRPGLTDECPRCEGDGKAHGADRACEWSSRPDYNICPVCRCEWCDGTGTERVADAAGDMDDATCRKCGGRKATGRVPRPCPATAHPITKVTLTTLPTAEVGEFNALRKWVRPLEWGGDTRDSFEAEWDWITFTFQGAEDRR